MSTTHRRFDRTARLLGDDGVARLAGATVTIFGLGGVGSFAAEALARSGVGRLILVDYDRICVTNVNRQLHALKGTLGKSKAEVMAERLRMINPDAAIDGRGERARSNRGARRGSVRDPGRPVRARSAPQSAPQARAGLQPARRRVGG